MCNNPQTHHGKGNCCGCGPQFLSKKKKIEHLNQHLTNLKERVKDIEDYIVELKAEK